MDDARALTQMVTETLLASFADALAEAFDHNRERLAAEGNVLPGARAALRSLADNDKVVQSVLTGNAEPIARCKLAAFGLDQFVDFDAGAYGMDGAERPRSLHWPGTAQNASTDSCSTRPPPS